MTTPRYAFIKANWHSNIVDKSLAGFCEVIPRENVDVFDVPGAFEMPLMARDVGKTNKYAAIAAAAFVVDGGIYRHDFVAQAVVQGLMQVSLELDIPVLSVSLTPHQYQETGYHNEIFEKHFIEKGKEAAHAARSIANARCQLERVG